MRAKSDIIAYLASQLTDDIWKKLQNSLLGRELLAFGAEVISENENVKDTMLLQMNPETADKNGLYMLSQMNEIPITNIKPSTLVVQMADSVKTYAPYELQYNVGNVHFTNIEYTMQGKSVSLINGTHKCYSVPNGSNISEGAIEDGSETFFYDGTTTYSGIKLGNAYPDSIVVTDENGLEIPRYSSDIALSNNIDMMYKVVTGVDGNTFVRFLKGGDTIPNPTAYKIDWLDHSAMEFEVDDTDVKDGNDVVATIEYYSQGVVDDLDYMRQQLKKEMAKYNGLNTPVSVENYVKGMPYILDAKCEKGEDGLCVYVKPSSPTPEYSTYLDFSEVAAHISLNSILFPNIKVRTANQIMFGVEISGVSDLKLQQGIKSLLQERFSYENMDFNTIINTGSILSEIYGKYGIVPTINMTIKEDFVQNKPLSFTPIKNSLKLYDSDDKILGWEDNGLLYGKTNIGSNIPFGMYDVVASMGTMFLLMLKGYGIKYSDFDPAKTGCKYLNDDTTQLVKVELYGEELNFFVENLNRFYLYDISTNTVKPFDGTLKNLLFTDQNADLKYSSWDKESEDQIQSFGNLYDIKFLSTNNALVVQFVFKSSGADTKIDGTEEYGSGETRDKYVPEYWSTNNRYYDYYFDGGNTSVETNANYKGKYQTTFFINNPLALRNQTYESWQIFQDAVHGFPTEIQGLYSGLRNITDNGSQLDIKCNWFVHNNKQYYAYDISDKYVCITNGAKNLKINLNGSFLGMIPYENDLYVINGAFITRVIGFEGLKEQEKVYRVYKDLNTPITITQIIREFDNQIVFKTSDNKFYTATGFDILADNMIGFKNLKQVFNDITIESGFIISGCTKDYVTAYKAVDTEVNNKRNVGYKFYCYDLNVSKTYDYSKMSEFNNQSTSGESFKADSFNLNLATYFPTNLTDNIYVGGNTGTLIYYDRKGNGRVLNDLNNVFILNNPNQETNRYGLFVDNIIDEENNNIYAYPVWQLRNQRQFYICSRTGAKWEDDSGEEGKIDTNFITGFYKSCLRNFLSQKNNYYNDFESTERKYKKFDEEHNNIIDVTETLALNNVSITYKDANYNDVTKNDWMEFTVYPDLVKEESGYKSISNTTKIWTLLDTQTTCEPEIYNPIGRIYYPSEISRFHEAGDLNDNEEPVNGEGNKVKCYKLNLKINTLKTINTITQEVEIGTSTAETAITTIGYFDTNNNSCVNDRGSQAVSVRYNTQNPNVTSGSYLMLDESEIKFV